jgi:glycosyltransferase involved in cell wall biosynthesis
MIGLNKILLVTGSYPADICGVGDYSKKLLESLNKESNIVELFYKKKWGIIYLFSYINEIKSKKANLVHFQYPTEGYGYSFLPLLLMIFLPKQKLIITIHELSNRTFKAKIFTLLMILFNNRIIVTNEMEYNFLKRIPVLKRKQIFVINIGSNIPASTNSLKNFSERKFDLAYFGHIRPIKGLESFISVSKSLDASKKCVVIGQNLNKYQSYLEELQVKSSNVSYILNGSVSETAENLSDCKIVYLPFPDGVSSRRGSLIAAALNGCIIVTTYSKDKLTNEFFSQYCYLVNNELEAVQLILELLSNKAFISTKETSKLMRMFSWEEIAKRHFEVYIQNI